MAEIEKIVQTLPKGIGLEWSGISYEERAAGAQAPALYALSVLVVFLCLAALYESWAVPLAVLMVMPLGILGAVLAAFWKELPNDVYLQVALLTTVGLASKNAILIVEFAKSLKEQGYSLIEAVTIAARQRFRPIVMTSMAFMLGVAPLAFAKGAGAASQNAIGITVMGGMAATLVVAIFFVPMFYVIVEKIFHRDKIEAADQKPHKRKINPMMRKTLSILFLSLSLSGCTMIPYFTHPDFSAASSWSEVPGYIAPTGETIAAQMDWKNFF